MKQAFKEQSQYTSLNEAQQKYTQYFSEVLKINSGQVAPLIAWH